MPGSLERSIVHVEGADDQHSMVHLLIRHGVDYDNRPWPAQYPEFKVSGSDRELLDGMTTAIQLSTGREIGFVLDADSPLADRWQAVRDRLAKASVDSPVTPPPDGFIGDSQKYRARVGVWLMPDNQHDGKLETFLRTLIGREDSLIGHAESATDGARQFGAKFTEVDRLKAILHAWLAWQEEPGLRYGTAIRAQYFRRHDSTAAVAFVAWFKALYGIR